MSAWLTWIAVAVAVYLALVFVVVRLAQAAGKPTPEQRDND